jgi:hypothetical protein
MKCLKSSLETLVNIFLILIEWCMFNMDLRELVSHMVYYYYYKNRRSLSLNIDIEGRSNGKTNNTIVFGL